MKSILHALVVATVLIATGCGANPTTTASLPLANAAKTAAPAVRNAAGTGTVTLSFKIPNHPTAAAHTRPQYVSASTQSVSVGVDGADPAATNCINPSTCSVTFVLSATTHALAVRLWDATNAGGKELASNTAGSCPVVANTANTCLITLYGLATQVQIVSSSEYVISGSQTNGFTLVSGAATPFTVVALDADDNQILGAGTITPAVSTTGSFTITTPAPNAAPSSAPVYTIADTNTSAQTVTISVTPAPNSDSTSVPPSNVRFTAAVPTPTPVPTPEPVVVTFNGNTYFGNSPALFYNYPASPVTATQANYSGNFTIDLSNCNGRDGFPGGDLVLDPSTPATTSSTGQWNVKNMNNDAYISCQILVTGANGVQGYVWVSVM